MLKKDASALVVSKWANSVVLTANKNGYVSFYIDCRELTAMTVRNTYPLQEMEECVDSLGDAAKTIFLTVCYSSGCWQIGIPEANRSRPAFSCHHEIFLLIRQDRRVC